MNDKKTKFINSNFRHFSSLPGSQHNASRSSALNLLDLLLKFNPKSVLDYGTGIGTLIPLYDFMNIKKIVAVEKNDWCRSQFIKNTRSFDNVFLKENLPKNSCFDFVVIDDEIDFQEIFSLISRDQFPKVVFIEGWRNRTVAKFSFVLLVRGFSALFFRGNDRSAEFQLSSQEKSGAWFILQNQKSSYSISSWVRRCAMTHEIREFRNFLLKTLGYFTLLRVLNLGAKIRKITKKQEIKKEKYWRREL